MGRYRIGFDFGTSSTKVCYYELDRKEFGLYKWSGNIDRPTVVSIKNGKLKYARNANVNSPEIYRYFKMASFIDPEYLTLLKEDIENINIEMEKLYLENNYFIHSVGVRVSAEFISSLYIANSVLHIKKNVGTSVVGSALGLGGGFFGRARQTEDTFSYVFGFPTEFNQRQHRPRLTKMQAILYVAFRLIEVYDSVEAFEEKKLDELLEMVGRILSELKSNPSILEEYLKQKGIRIYPEAAASLAFIIKNGSLSENKYYATMDIGAGTSDIALFNITGNNTIRYLASESISIASNNLAATYMEDPSNEAIAEFNRQLSRSFRRVAVQDKFNSSLDEFQYALSQSIYRLYNHRAYSQLKDDQLTAREAFDGQQCLMYGGGAEFFRSRRGQKMTLHDNFSVRGVMNPTSLVTSPLVEKDNLNFEFRGKSGLSDFELSKILVALGLSITISETNDHTAEIVPAWLFLGDYRDGSRNRVYRDLAHDTNEDRYIRVYDIVEQKEITYDRPVEQIEFYIGAVTDPSTDEVFKRVQSISTPPDESEVEEHMDWMVFSFEFEITQGVVNFFAMESDQRFETDLSFTLKDLAASYNLSLRSMPTSKLEDFISDKAYGLSDYIYVNQESFNNSR